MLDKLKDHARERLPTIYSWLRRTHRRYLSARPHRHVFRKAYETNLWGSEESRSGKGSTLETTALLRASLPTMLSRLEIRVLLDIPCGDHNWMSHVDLDAMDYIGADVVPEVVAAAAQNFAGPRKRFEVVNLLGGRLPAADAILCRDCLVHFSHRDVWRGLGSIKRSGATYLLTTTFPDREANDDIVTGEWRPLNLQLSPFSFPEPLGRIREYAPDSSDPYKDKTLAVWAISDLPTK